MNALIHARVNGPVTMASLKLACNIPENHQYGLKIAHHVFTNLNNRSRWYEATETKLMIGTAAGVDATRSDTAIAADT